MAWITDVAPQTTIRSVWGNSVRDCVVHQFADFTEANAHALPNGTHAAIGGVPYVRRGGAWVPLLPTPVAGSYPYSGNVGNIEQIWGRLVLPGGYSGAVIQGFVVLSGAAGDNINLRGKTGATTWVTINSGIGPNGWTTLAFGTYLAVAGITIDFSVVTDYQHTIAVYPDGSTKNVSAVMYP